MRLAEYTDYTLRVLIYCASNRDRLVTIAELSEQYRVSKNHLMKIVNALARQGVVETSRGRGGGLRLSMEPGDITVGDIVRRSETDFRLVECFDAPTNGCVLTPVCRLKHVLGAALTAYFRELDGATLADIAVPLPVGRPPPRASGRGAVVAAPASRRPAAGRAR